jgi:hypothetical protein
MAEQDFENEEIFDEKAEDRPKFSLQTVNDEICCGDCVLKKRGFNFRSNYIDPVVPWRNHYHQLHPKHQ